MKKNCNKCKKEFKAKQELDMFCSDDCKQEAGIHNEVMIRFLDEQVKKLQSDVEKLKDSNREIHYKNGKTTE